jgi:hypothetical protein
MKVFKVVKFNEVEQWTFQGWEFVMVVMQSRAETIHCSTPVPAHSCNNNYSSSGYASASREEAVQVHEALFMLSKDGEEISRELVLTGKLDLAVTEGKKLVEQLAVAEKNATKEQEGHFAYQKRYDELNKTHYELVAKTRTLEGDLGKVRTAIGSQAFDAAIKGP